MKDTMKKICLWLIPFSYSLAAYHPVQDVKQIVLWGHKLATHTHSYIHWGFKRAFEYMGYKTLWLDNRDNVQHIDFANSLFITEGQVDQKIPVRSDCFYILHNCNQTKYQDLLSNGHAIILQVYTHDCLKRKEPSLGYCFHYDIKQPVIYMPWATDLLPHEIDEQKLKIASVRKNQNAIFVGSAGGMGGFGNQIALEGFKLGCQKDGRHLIIQSACSCSMEDNIRLIQEAYLAPALQGEWQCAQGYIPCRIFKNISYGALGVTNSETVYHLFNDQIVYNSNTQELYHDAAKTLKTWSLEDQYRLMDFVRDNHTYIHRIASLFDFFEMVAAHKKGA